MNATNVRSFVTALETLAEQRKITIDHKLQLKFSSWCEDALNCDDWVLHINTDVGSKRALDLWDEICQLCIDHHIPELTISVGWLMDEEIEKEKERIPCE